MLFLKIIFIIFIIFIMESNLKEAILSHGFEIEENKSEGRSKIIIRRNQINEGIPSSMVIYFDGNNWGDEKRYKQLELDDYYISALEFAVSPDVLETMQPDDHIKLGMRGSGKFTEFIKDLLKIYEGQGKRLIVGAPTPYWERRFTLTSLGSEMYEINQMVTAPMEKASLKKKSVPKKKKSVPKKKKSVPKKKKRKSKKKKRKS
jgi:hypothetical protein